MYHDNIYSLSSNQKLSIGKQVNHLAWSIDIWYDPHLVPRWMVIGL